MKPLETVQEAIKEYGRPLWVAHVPQGIRVQVPVQELARLLAEAHTSPSTVTRTDQYESIVKWCRGRVFEEVTIADLESVSGLSAPSVRKFIGERPDIFRKLRRGVWEIRDPEADREADRR
jgi:hypothetical protein